MAVRCAGSRADVIAENRASLPLLEHGGEELGRWGTNRMAYRPSMMSPLENDLLLFMMETSTPSRLGRALMNRMASISCS